MTPAPLQPPALAGDSPKAGPAQPGAITLAQLIERARRRDPRAGQADAQLQHAQAKREEIGFAWFPVIETTLAAAGPTPEARLNANPTSLLDVTPGTAHGWGELGIALRAQATAVIPLYSFGKWSAGKSAAQHGVGFAEAMLERARDQSTYDITRAFWGYQTAHAGTQSVDGVRKRLADAQKTAQGLLADGSDQITKNDSLKLDYLKEELEAQYAATVKNEHLAMNGMRALVGAEPAEVLQVEQRVLPPPPEVPDRDKMVQLALEKRPESRAATEGVAARQALVDLERARLYPDLGLVGGATYTYTSNASNPNTPFAYNPYNERTAYVALALRGTLDFPQKFARLKQSEADLSEAQALARGAEQLIRLEVDQALGDLQEAHIRFERYSKQAAIGKQLAVKAGVAFEGGLGEARELLEDTLLYARADGERLKSLFDAQIAWAALAKAVGGL